MTYEQIKKMLWHFWQEKIFYQQKLKDYNELLKEAKKSDGAVSKEYLELMRKELKELEHRIVTVEKVVSQMEQPHQSVIYQKYIKNLQSKDIAKMYGYTINRMYQMQTDATKIFIEMFAKAYNKSKAK